MRSVNAASSKPRGRGRAAPNRRNAPVRVAQERQPFGKRKKFRTDPVSRLIRAVRNGLNPRRPSFIVTVLLALIGVIVFLFAAGYVHRGTAAVNAALATVSADAGFEISAIQLSGNRYTAPGDISAKLGFSAGDSVFAVDPQQARANLRTLDWVSDADVTVRYPDRVNVRIIEKAPFALWQSDHGLYAVGRDGQPITKVALADFKHLPLFFGDRPDGASDLVEAIGAHRAVAARVKAMQLVSNRRWNLVLDDGVLVKLPEDGWAKELGTLERLIVDQGVLERDIAEIDLRSHDNYFFVLRHPTQPPHKNPRGEPT